MRHATFVILHAVTVAAVASLAACDSGGPGGAPLAVDAAGDAATPAAVTTPWTPPLPEDPKTTKAPTFELDCRLSYGTLLQRASNGASDDALTLVEPTGEGDATASVVAREGGGEILRLDLVLDRSKPKAKAWSGATGTVTWLAGAPLTGTVLDGRLCFESNVLAASGAPVRGELSVVFAGDDGQPYSVGADFAVPAEAVGASADANDVSVVAPALDLDLR